MRWAKPVSGARPRSSSPIAAPITFCTAFATCTTIAAALAFRAPIAAVPSCTAAGPAVRVPLWPLDEDLIGPVVGASITAGAACLLGILVLYCCRRKSKRRAASQALRQSSTAPTDIATGVPVAVPTAVPVAVPTAVPTGWMVERVATTIVKPSPDWKLGITLETVTGSGKIEIVSAAAGSPTEAAGLRAGDVVVEIAGGGAADGEEAPRCSRRRWASAR